MKRCGLVTLVLLTFISAGCASGSSGASTPESAATIYLRVLAVNNGQKACDVLSLNAREQVMPLSGPADCKSVITEVHNSLGADASRLKDAQVSGETTTGGASRTAGTTVAVTLDGRTVTARVVKVDGHWQLDTMMTGSARRLLGIVSLSVSVS